MEAAKDKLLAHHRHMTFCNERARIFSNEQFWFKWWEAHVAMKDTLAVRMRELLQDVVVESDGRASVRIEEEEKQLDEEFGGSFEELLAEMKLEEARMKAVDA